MVKIYSKVFFPFTTTTSIDPHTHHPSSNPRNFSPQSKPSIFLSSSSSSPPPSLFIPSKISLPLSCSLSPSIPFYPLAQPSSSGPSQFAVAFSLSSVLIDNSVHPLILQRWLHLGVSESMQ
ncbi:hypothetical protein DM860_012715 [Cuscuta australis]|uniref:Uncharacterized protein n=1 Tax=Cuscuta australis TaxID=267555 RepID=A0A328DDE4_9ASTE|nr:hypothetical protein DM860_012715 [Cuscuta australis]